MAKVGIEAAAARPRRDALGRACFTLHIAVMIFIASGWMIPMRGFLIFYLAFLPATMIQWQFNKHTCVLNNFESMARHRRWRDAGNPEEGAWLRTLLQDSLGLRLRPAQLDTAVYGLLAGLWGLGLAHLLRG